MNERYLEALAHYDLTAGSVRRGRSGWICETDRGTMLLQEYRGTMKRLEFENQVLAQVRESGLILVDDYIQTAEGELISLAEDGTRYTLKHWYTGRECNLKDRREICQVTGKIAVLHQIMQKIPVREEWNLGSILVESAEAEMMRHNQELKRARNFMKNKRKKTEFERCALRNFSIFFAQADKALEGMERLSGNKGGTSVFLCHGDLDQHHILIEDTRTAVIEYHKMHLGNQMTDLYHFMRKVMEKYDWNQNLGMEMLEAYDKVLPLKRRDRDSLYFLFLYPEKFWKQINFYMNSNKVWIPARNLDKLKGLEAQTEQRNRFLSIIA